MRSRDYNIDFLRFLGLTLIILAHVNPPFLLQQIRSFDVPLMVFVSGMACSLKKDINIKSFYINRTKRLLIPVWIFLVFILLLLYIAQINGLIPFFLTQQKIIESFLLLNGIGYVWIIRVFLLMMLITPLLGKLHIRHDSSFFFLILIVIFLQLFFTSIDFSSTILNFLYKEYFLYLVGYLPLFLLGQRIREQSGFRNKYFVGIFLLFVLTFSLHLFLYGFPITITDYKYPPRSYYIVYGMFLSSILWLGRSHLVYYLSIINFVGRNTIWIYLWHIPFIMFANHFFDNWFAKYVLVYSCSILVFYIQYKIVTSLNSKFINKYFQG